MNDPVKRIILNAQKYSYQWYEKSTSNKASIDANADDNHHRTINPASTQNATDLIIFVHAIHISSSATFKRKDIWSITPRNANGKTHKNNICVDVAEWSKSNLSNKKKYKPHNSKDDIWRMQLIQPYFLLFQLEWCKDNNGQKRLNNKAKDIAIQHSSSKPKSIHHAVSHITNTVNANRQKKLVGNVLIALVRLLKDINNFMVSYLLIKFFIL